MKTRTAFFALPFAIALAFALPEQHASAGVTISISTFYDELSPHGEWISISRYGRCWRPARVGRDWQPYLHGEWVYTDYGWTWVSSDPWGGDPYHYGTWDFDDDAGWYWIPGTIWAPAWVTWHTSDSTIGWAPVRPSLTLSASGYLGPAITVSRTSYVFVPANQFVGSSVLSVRLPVTQNATFLAQTRPVTRFAATRGVLTSGGPSIQQVQQATRTSIPRVRIADAHTRIVPLRDSFRQGGRGVIAPAAERARFTGDRPGRGNGTIDPSVDRRNAPPEQRPLKSQKELDKRERKADKREIKEVQREGKFESKLESKERKADLRESKHERKAEERAPVVREEPRRAEPNRAEPRRAERAEPQRAEPQRAEPQRHEPQAEPPGQAKRGEPARNEPAPPASQPHGNGHGQNKEKEHGKKDR